MKDAVASMGENERIFKCLCMIVDYRTKGRVACDNKRNTTGLACGSLDGFKCFVACVISMSI